MREFINIINEASGTADDIFRKIEALDNMIKDKATTPGEKANAANLKNKLEQKLATEFPGAKPSAKAKANPYMPDDIHNMYADWFDDLVKAAQQQQKYDDVEADPTKDRSWIKDEINQLKKKRKYFTTQAALGDVEAARARNAASNRIEQLLSKYFPDEYDALLAKRAKANDAAYDRRAKNRDEKVATMKAAADKSGLSFSQAAKGHEEVLKKIYKLVTGKTYNRKTSYGSLHLLVFYKMEQVGTKALRAAFAQLSAAEQTELRDVVKSIHTVGHVGYSYADETNNGYTEAQKIKVLKGMDILKQADGMTYKEFENKYDPILKGFTYKPGRWSNSGQPVDNPVAEMGSSGNNKSMREYVLGWMDKLLTDQQRSEMLEDIKQVNPATPKEERIVFGWKSLLNPEDEEGGLSWDQFKDKFKDTIESVNYKRGKWEKDESLFDIFGKSQPKYYENEIRGLIKNKLTAEQKTELLAGLDEVTPKNATEKARIKRLKGYLE